MAGSISINLDFLEKDRLKLTFCSLDISKRSIILLKKSRFIDMDTDKITQVLYNIISNALKYSPEGGTVTYRLRDRGDLLEISVSDQGMGIPKGNSCLKSSLPLLSLS